jgi:peptidoglycan/xylan/chitin deacetylase (PgdA/CDA1 family)
MVLAYHRIAELARDPQWLAVRPSYFDEHLKVLRSDYHLLSLADAMRRTRSGEVPPKSVVVTFDDGYADNLEKAKPLLEKYSAPATVFVATDQIGRPLEFWWDELDATLLGSRELPPQLKIAIGQQSYSWRLADSKTAHGANDNTAGWNMTMESTPSARHKVYRELSALVRDLDAPMREEVLSTLARWAGVDRHARLSHRTLTSEEVRSLARGGLVEVGAHTVTHPVLALRTRDEQRSEIAGSKTALERILQQPVHSFSYPFGRREDYNADSVAAVKEAGFDQACSNFPGLLGPETAAFAVPRFLVRDWPEAEFRRQLEIFYHS